MLADDLFRRHYRDVLATLTRLFGARHFDLAEEVTQEALVRALEVWPFSGVPANPSAWLIQTARRKAIDRLRRDRFVDLAEADIDRGFDQPPSPFGDDILAMIFLCCHPSLAPEMQIALTLQAVCGLNAREIGRAFLLPEATVAQRLVGAKRSIRQRGRSFGMPSEVELASRLDSALSVLYLLFNEGYASNSGDSPVRVALCDEAIYLARLLAAHPATAGPAVDARTALFLLQASRLPARGGALTLEEQDRTLWDSSLLAEGMHYFERSIVAGAALTRYHCEVAIASEHAVAPAFEATNWTRIVRYYDDPLAIAPGPAVELNRAIAIRFRHGPQAAIELLDDWRLSRNWSVTICCMPRWAIFIDGWDCAQRWRLHGEKRSIWLQRMHVGSWREGSRTRKKSGARVRLGKAVLKSLGLNVSSRSAQSAACAPIRKSAIIRCDSPPPDRRRRCLYSR